MQKIKSKISSFNFKQFKFKGSATKGKVTVEIGNDYLKVLENANGVITKVKIVPLVDIKGSVADALNKIFKDFKLSRRNVYVSLPRHLATIRILELPSTDEEEINDMVNLQLGKQTPYSKEEILYAYRIFDSNREGYNKAMIIIVRKSIVNERLEVFQKAGIDVNNVIISSEGVFHWFCYAHMMKAGREGKTLVLLDIDSNYSDFLVIQKGKLVYSRNILIGSKNLIGEVGKWEEKFVEEVSHSVELYYNEDRYVDVDKIYISGSGYYIKGLDQFLATRLALAVETADPSANIKVQKQLQDLKTPEYKYVSLSSLMGISLRYDSLELDLTPSDLRIQKVMDERRRQLTIMGVLTTSILMIISLFVLYAIYSRNVYLTNLKKKIVEMEKISQKVDNMRMSIDLIKKRLDSRKRSINVFYELHKLTPKAIYYTSIDIEERKKTVLQGNADKMSEVFEFVTVLENSDYFENVKTTYTSTKKTREGEYAKFEIVCAAELEDDF